MATVEQRPAATSNGAHDGIPVENPATGEVIATVPGPVRPTRSRRSSSGPAPRSPVGGARLRGPRRGSCAARRSGCIDNAERIIDTIVSETGKTYEDAQLAEITYAAAAFGFWAKMAPEYLADEKIRSSNLFVKGASSSSATARSASSA